jgi:hypothetical protein
VLKENIKSKLRAFERKVLRRIYGLTKESDGTRRIKSNDKLNKLIGNKNIINTDIILCISTPGKISAHKNGSLPSALLWCK